jgi:hypothetical protein
MQSFNSNALRSSQRGSLYWLQQPPADFVQRCRAVLSSPESVGDRIQALASYDLNENQLDRIANLIAMARAAG